MNDNLIEMIQNTIKNNDKSTELCQMALLAEQALIHQDQFDEAIDSITDAK